jgi:hypothetical protein
MMQPSATVAMHFLNLFLIFELCIEGRVTLLKVMLIMVGLVECSGLSFPI